MTTDDPALKRIRAAGGRITSSTRAVLSILAGTDEHLTAEDVIGLTGKLVPGVAPSTVYRVLQRLQDLDVVEHVHSGVGPSFFHLRERGHAHLACNSCGVVVDIPDSVFEQLAATVRSTYGFSVEPHHAAILGRCGDCDPAGQHPPARLPHQHGDDRGHHHG